MRTRSRFVPPYKARRLARGLSQIIRTFHVSAGVSRADIRAALRLTQQIGGPL